MTKTQLRLQRLEAHCAELSGVRRSLLRVWMFILEIFVAFHKVLSVFFKGKSKTFEQFAKRSADGSYAESFTQHEKFRKASFSGATFAVLLAVVYITSGIFIPNKVGIRAATFTVNDMGDGGDGICDENCTLRDALSEANSTGGIPDTINFDVGGTIYIGSELPNLGDDGTYIDGDTNADGVPDVVLDGTAMVSGNGLNIVSDGNTIHGLVLKNFPGDGILIHGSHNTITSTYIGTNDAGTAAAPNGGIGIHIEEVPGFIASTDNAIGSTTPGETNVVSGNGGDGIRIEDATSIHNNVMGTRIGTNAAGTAAIPNGNDGVAILNGANSSTIGQNNVISGNARHGVYFSGAATNTNLVGGNYIGLNAAGSAALPNGGNGVEVASVGVDILIGGTDEADKNIISGNAGKGIAVTSTSGVTLQNNFIGTNASGTAVVANGEEGIALTSTASPLVRYNLISGNTSDGLLASGVTGGTFLANYVGINLAGTSALANGRNGFSFTASSHDNVVGSETPGEQNIISGNTGAGVVLGYGVGDQSSTKDNILKGNYVGTNVVGDAAIGNGTYGVLLQNGVNGNTLGGNVAAASCTGKCNLFSGNISADVVLESSATNNVVQGNVVGLNLAATKPIRLDNEATGIQISGGAFGNTIGGTRVASASEIGEGNVVGGYIADADHDGSYSGDGIALASDAYDVDTHTGNSLLGNLVGVNFAGSTQDIYTNASGASGADNINDLRSRNGISVLAPYTVIGDGTADHTNVISGNTVGVYLKANSGIDHVSINGNYIGTDKTGEVAQKSGGYTENTSYKFNFGILASGTDYLTVRNNVLSGFSQATVEGSKNAQGMALVLGYFGVNAPNGDNTNATIAGNKIGTDKDGTTAVSNYIGLVCEQLSDSIVGGSNASDRNIISGNGSSGSGVAFGTFALGETSGCHDITVQNNYFGTDVTGTVALENNVGLDFQKSVHDITFDANLFGEKSSLGMTGAQTVGVANNVFGIGTDGTTRFNGRGNADVSILQSSDITLSANQFGHTDGRGVNVEASTNVSVDGNYIGTNAAKSATFGLQGGVAVIGGDYVTVSNNTIRNITDRPIEKYLVANSQLSYGGNDYTETWNSNGFSECSGVIPGMNTLYYSSGLATVYTGKICGQTQAFTGITHISGSDAYLNDVKAYLISKSGHHYTMLVSQSSGGPFSCSYIATNTFSGGTCDKEFTLFSLSGSTYSAQTLPSGVSLVAGSPDPSMNKYEYTSGISVVGSEGNTSVANNEVSSSGRGILVIGGTDVSLETNSIHDNSGSGIILTETTYNLLTQNTVSESGSNGIELHAATNNTLGSVGNGNAISGEDLNGIALLSQSNENTLSSNQLTNNGNVGTVNGAGIFINESSSNILYNNAANNNVRGIAVSSSDEVASTDNIIGGTSTNQPNAMNNNASSGILIQGNNTQGNTVSGNTVSTNGAYGIESSDTHTASATPSETGDNILTHNTVTLNAFSGIRSSGASPAITNNTITSNGEHGIDNVVDFGASANPDTENDDVLSEPRISGNQINDNHTYGIYSLDTAPFNKATLKDDNDFDENNESGQIRQDWFGLVETLADGATPEADASVQVFGNGQTDALTEFTTAENGFGPSSSSLMDVQTWQVIPEYEVSPSGTLQEYAPHRIFATGSAGTAIFAFDGSEKTSDDFGNIHGRYQVATVDLTQAPNTVSGKVFSDVNKNGSLDTDESGTADVTVTLYLSEDTTFGNDSVVGTPVVTGASGEYTFTNIPQGKYFVTISVPTGFVVTTSNPSNLITFASEAQTETRNFGIAENPVVTADTGTIRGTVFEDNNSNALFEGGESGLSNVTVKLFEDTNANQKYDEGTDTLVTTSTSNTSGVYQFTNQPFGNYFLTVTVPENRKLTTDNSPTKILALTTAGQTLTENFGLTPLPKPEEPVVPPGGGGKNPITKFISGAASVSFGILAPQTGAATANAVAAAAAVTLGLVNLLAAIPGSSWPAASRLLLDGFTEPLLALFGSRKLPWGRLFDSLSKKPLDLGLVRLYDAKSKILLGTAVTDRTGRFKFLPKSGRYIAKASKAGYAFPSSLLTAAPVYEKQNLYFGDQFTIDDMNQTFTKDIPLDPPQMVGDNKSLLKMRAKQTAHDVFAFGGITISLVNIILLFSWLTLGLFALHVILLAFFWRLGRPAKPKSWGIIYDQDNRKPVSGAIIRIYDQKFGRLLDTAISDRNGKFGFLVGASSYYLTAEANGFLFPGTAKSSKRDYIGGAMTVGEKDTRVACDIPLKRMN